MGHISKRKRWSGRTNAMERLYKITAERHDRI
jgi:hypothetical protein